MLEHEGDRSAQENIHGEAEESSEQNKSVETTIDRYTQGLLEIANEFIRREGKSSKVEGEVKNFADLLQFGETKDQAWGGIYFEVRAAAREMLDAINPPTRNWLQSIDRLRGVSREFYNDFNKEYDDPKQA